MSAASMPYSRLKSQAFARIQGMDSQPAVEPDANYGGVTLSQLEEFLAVRKGCLADILKQLAC